MTCIPMTLRELAFVAFLLSVVACTPRPAGTSDAEKRPVSPAPATSVTTTSTPPAEPQPVPLLQSEPRLVPADEALKDPSFAAFRSNLQSIVRQRDVEKLLSVVDPHIRVSFGDENGVEALRQILEAPQSPLWDELGDVLALGGVFQKTPNGNVFVAPYAFANWPETGDPFESLVAICPDLTLFEKPSDSSKALARLDWNLLPIGPNDPSRKGVSNPPWRELVLPDGRRGWVESRCVRSGIDYRAAFEKKEGTWRMVYFVAGD